MPPAGGSSSKQDSELKKISRFKSTSLGCQDLNETGKILRVGSVADGIHSENFCTWERA
jgi:hypothetical protein